MRKVKESGVGSASRTQIVVHAVVAFVSGSHLVEYQFLEEYFWTLPVDIVRTRRRRHWDGGPDFPREEPE